MATPIIEIDVRDQAFKKFLELFGKYEDAVKGLKGEWEKAGDSADDANKETAAGNRDLEERLELLRKIAAEEEKHARHAGMSEKALGNAARSSESLAKSLATGTLSLIKWAGLTGIAGGLLGLGGLAGVDRLSRSASEARLTSQRIGVDTGTLRAFRNAYSKFGSPETILGAIANAQQDQSSWGSFVGMGINNFQGREPDELAGEMALRAHDIYKQTGGNWSIAQARGIDKFYSQEDYRVLGTMTREEIQQMTALEQAQKRQLQNADSENRAWQDLKIKLNLSGEQIESVLIKKLVQLAPGIEHLSEVITKITAKFINWLVPDNYGKGQWNAPGGGSFLGPAGWNPDNPRVITLDPTGGATTGWGDAARSWLERHTGIPFRRGDAAAGEPVPAGEAVPVPGHPGYTAIPDTDRAAVLAGLERQYGLPSGYLAAQEQIESSGGKDPSMSAVPGSHANGAFQFQPGTWAEFGRGDVHNERDSAEAAARYDAKLLRDAGYDPNASAEENQLAIAKALASYLGVRNKLDNTLAGGGSLDSNTDLTTAIRELTMILRANAGRGITISNQTGAGVATIANAAATQK